MGEAFVTCALLASCSSSPSPTTGAEPTASESSLPAPTEDQGCNHDAIRRDAGKILKPGTKTQSVIAITFAIKSVQDRILGELEENGPWAGGDECLRALAYANEVFSDLRSRGRD